MIAAIAIITGHDEVTVNPQALWPFCTGL